MNSAISLKRLFNRLNHKWWGGQLPEVTCLWRPCDDALGKTIREYDERGQLLNIEIWIDPKIEALDCVVRLTMLHEMGHIVDARHGKKWKAEMTKLWNAGAFFAEKAI
jgi:hypothetical protein